MRAVASLLCAALSAAANIAPGASVAESAVSGCAGSRLGDAPSFRVDFANRAAGCTVKNYKDRSAILFRERDGRSEMAVGVVGTNGIDMSWGIETPAFPVKAGREFAVRLEMSGTLPQSNYINPGAKLLWRDAAGAQMKTVDALGNDVFLSTPLAFPLRKEGLGVSVAHTKSLVPQGAASAVLSVVVDHPDILPGEEIAVRGIEYFEHEKDEAWRFSDLEAPELEILTPSPCADLHAPVRFRLRDATGTDYSSMRCFVDGRDVTGSLSEEKATDGTKVFSFPPADAWRPESVVSVEVRCSDVRGNAAAEWGFVAFTQAPARHAKWTVRDDGMVLKDGVPFFPLGICSVHADEPNGNDLDRAVRELKAAGFNLAHTYMVRGRRLHAQSAHYDELVEACAKHGVCMLPEPSIRYGTLAQRDALLMPNVLYGRGCAGMFGWGVGDDTSRLQSPRDLKRLHRVCKAADSDLLTVSIDAIASSAQQAPYIPFADVMILEQYPLRQAAPQDDEMAKMASGMDSAWEAVRISGTANRSVMSMPQTFKGFNRWERFPTTDELRAMTFIPIACRARGIVYYTYYSSKANPAAFSTPESKATVTAVSREVAAILPDLVARDAARQPTVEVIAGSKVNALGGASVRCLLKSGGLLVAANTSHLPVTAVIRLPDGASIRHEFARNGVLVEKVSGANRKVPVD